MFSDRTIRSLISLNIISVDPCQPFESKSFQPGSLEFHLGPDLIMVEPERDIPYQMEEWYVISPDECILGHTIECLTLPDNMVARVEGKSSWGRKFIMIHSTAGFIDPGFSGRITLEIKNIGTRKVMLRVGDPICQVSFDWLDQPAARPYGHPDLQSHYQGQSTVTPAYDGEDRYA